MTDLDDRSFLYYDLFWNLQRSMFEFMKLSLIVPCFNEQDNVGAFFDACTAVFDGKISGFEIIFINDGSKDGTWNALKEIYNKNKNTNCKIKLINFSRNFGKEPAIYAGLKRATGEYVSVIDADLQQRPEIVVDMVSFLDNNSDYDSVAAYQSKRTEGRFSAFLKKCFYGIINNISTVRFRSDASDFRTFRRNVAESLLEMPEYHRFSKGLFSWVGFNTYYIPYVAEKRHAGETSWSKPGLFGYALDGIVSFSVAPLRLATFAGFLSAAAAIIYMIVVIIEKFVQPIIVPGYATIVVLLLFIGGVQLIALGIIGEYIARIYVQSKNRPVYIEKEYLSDDSEN